jgi:hypothetical protein
MATTEQNPSKRRWSLFQSSKTKNEVAQLPSQPTESLPKQKRGLRRWGLFGSSSKKDNVTAEQLRRELLLGPKAPLQEVEETDLRPEPRREEPSGTQQRWKSDFRSSHDDGDDGPVWREPARSTQTQQRQRPLAQYAHHDNKGSTSWNPPGKPSHTPYPYREYVGGKRVLASYPHHQDKGAVRY